MAIIESEVRITGKDAGASAMFDSIAAKIDRMNKNAKVSSPFSNLAKEFSVAESKLKALDKLNSSKALSDVAKQRAAITKAALDQQRALVAAEEAPTKAMLRNLEAREAAHAKAMTMARREATLGMEARRAAVAQGLSLHNLEGQQASLRRQIEGTTAAMERQVAVEKKAAVQAAAVHAATERQAEKRSHFLAHHGLVGTMLGAAAGAATIHGVFGVGERAWEAGAERQHVVTGMLTAGMSQEEIDRAQELAIRTSQSAPNMSVSQLMELHKEARSAVQHPEEVFELMPELAKAASALKGMGNEGNIADLVKAGESLGLMNDPKRFHTFLEGQVKAMQVFGRTISTEQIYEAAKYSKATGSTLSDEFLNGTLPSLIQEMHGSSAGDALSALSKRFRGGLMHQHLAVERLNQMGLLDDPSQIKRSKTGEIIGYGGKLKGDEQLISNPGLWFTSFFKEGAAKVGAKSLADINKLLAEVLPSTAANLGRILIQQEESIKQHHANLEGATGLDETIEKQRADWNAATQAFKASMEDLGAAVTGVNMGRAASGLSWLSGQIKTFAKVASDHPYVSVPVAGAAGAAAVAGVGYLGAQLLTAGTSLQTAATMLQEAAVSQGAARGGILPKVAGGGAGLAVEGGALASGGIGLAAGLGVAGTLAGLGWLIHKSAEAQQPGHGGAWAPATLGSLENDRYALAEQQDRLGHLQARAEQARTSAKFPDMPNPVLQQLEDEIADLKNQIAAREESLSRIPYVPVGVAGGLPTMTAYDVSAKRKGGVTLPGMPLTSIGSNTFLTDGAPAIDVGKAGWSGPPAPAQTVDITGKIPVDITTGGVIRVDVQASPELLARVGYQGIMTQVKAPSTGASMPNAGLPTHPGRMGPN